MTNKRIFAPHRKNYINNINDKIKSSCFFCDFSTKKPSKKNHVILNDGTIMVMLNRYPYTTAHLMFVPLRHLSEFENISQQEHAAINNNVSLFIKILKKIYKPHGFNYGLNIGEASGAGVPGHLHFHLVPRWYHDSNFMTALAEVRIIPDDLDNIYDAIKKEYNNERKRTK